MNLMDNSLVGTVFSSMVQMTNLGKSGMWSLSNLNFCAIVPMPADDLSVTAKVLPNNICCLCFLITTQSYLTCQEIVSVLYLWQSLVV